jgi:hypothetical protein
VREIAEASRTGAGTNIISGTAVGFETTFVTAISIGVALLASHWLGSQAGLVSADGHDVGGVFGTAVATMGMLMTTAYILAMDTFGPITDNAGGVAEFSRSEASAREITDRLDAVGNTTKALTKGYAIASASLAAFLLFSAYIDKVNLIQRNRGGELLEAVNLADIEVFVAASSARCSSTSSARWPSVRWARQRSRSSSRCAGSSARCRASWTTASGRTTHGWSTSPRAPPCGRWWPPASWRSRRRSPSASSSDTRRWPASSWSARSPA